MNATTHAPSGLAAGLVVGGLLPLATGHVTFTVDFGSVRLESQFVAAVAFAFVVAAFAIAPDIDHFKSRATRMWGPFSEWPTGPLRLVFKHRGPTHWLIPAVALTAGAMWAASQYPIAAAVMVAVTTGLALTGMDELLPGDTKNWVNNLALSAAAGCAAYWFGWYPWWLPVAAGLGVAVHILGDELTTQGRLGLFTTGGFGESIVFAACLATIAWWFSTQAGYDPANLVTTTIRSTMDAVTAWAA